MKLNAIFDKLADGTVLTMAMGMMYAWRPMLMILGALAYFISCFFAAVIGRAFYPKTD